MRALSRLRSLTMLTLLLALPAFACDPVPGVVPFMPAAAVTDVPLDAILVANVTATELDCAVDVTDPDGEIIGGEVSVGCDGTCCVFTPDAPLQANATYTVAWFGGLDGDLALTADTTFSTGSAGSQAVAAPVLAVGFVDREPSYTTCNSGDEWSYPVSMVGEPGRNHFYELAVAGAESAILQRIVLGSIDDWDDEVFLPPGSEDADVDCFVARAVDAAGRTSPWTEPACPAGYGNDGEPEGCGCASASRAGSGALGVLVLAGLALLRRRGA